MTIDQALRVAEIERRVQVTTKPNWDDHEFIRSLVPSVYAFGFRRAIMCCVERALFVLAEHVREASNG